MSAEYFSSSITLANCQDSQAGEFSDDQVLLYAVLPVLTPYEARIGALHSVVE